MQRQYPLGSLYGGITGYYSFGYGATQVERTQNSVLTGQTGQDPIFRGAADFDLDLIESRTLDGNIQELTYRPTLHL